MRTLKDLVREIKEYEHKTGEPASFKNYCGELIIVKPSQDTVVLKSKEEVFR